MLIERKSTLNFKRATPLHFLLFVFGGTCYRKAAFLVRRLLPVLGSWSDVESAFATPHRKSRILLLGAAGTKVQGGLSKLSDIAKAQPCSMQERAGRCGILGGIMCLALWLESLRFLC